jgi:type I restriction enzyme, S subunit
MTLQGSIAFHGNPAGWPETPLRALLSQTDQIGRVDLPLLGVGLHQGVRRRDDNDGRPAASEDLSGYKVVREGDVIMNRLGKPHGSVGVSPWRGITSPAYWVMEIDRSRAVPEFMHHLLRSNHMVREYERLGKFMPPNQFDISWDAFRSIRVPLPPLDEQRRIADFLDAETEQIDRLVECRKEQIAAVRAHNKGYISEMADELSRRYGTVKLRHVLQKIEQGWSPQCEDRLAADDEWGVVKAGCVNGGAFDASQHKALPVSTVPELRYRLHPGDLLMSRASGSVDLIGSIGVVPADLPSRLLLCDKVYRLRMDRTRMTPHFVALMLNTHRVREQIKLGISGADGMANNLPTAAVTNLRLPLVPLTEQTSIVREQSNRQGTTRDAQQKLSEQLASLAQRKLALITAAVTGQIDVTTVGRLTAAVTSPSGGLA